MKKTILTSLVILTATLSILKASERPDLDVICLTRMNDLKLSVIIGEVLEGKEEKWPKLTDLNKKQSYFFGLYRATEMNGYENIMNSFLQNCLEVEKMKEHANEYGLGIE